MWCKGHSFMVLWSGSLQNNSLTLPSFYTLVHAHLFYVHNSHCCQWVPCVQIYGRVHSSNASFWCPGFIYLYIIWSLPALMCWSKYNVYKRDGDFKNSLILKLFSAKIYRNQHSHLWLTRVRFLNPYIGTQRWPLFS